nr:hypothetical protein [Tanacetum cinerariifolium]
MTTLKFADTHNMVVFLSKPTESDGFEQIVDFLNAHPIRYALTANPAIYISCIKQLWSTVMAKTINGEVHIYARVDGKEIVITESSVRRDLQLADEEGIDCLPNFTIFEQLALMGFSNATDPHHTPIILQPSSSQPQKIQKPRKPKRNDTQVPQPSSPTNNVVDKVVHKELSDSLVRAATTASSLKAKQDSVGGPRCQETMRDTTSQTRVLDLEKTKTTQLNEIDSLKMRVKKLEKRNRSRTHKLKRLYKVGLTARVESSRDKEILGKDASKLGRRIDVIDVDDEITIVNDVDNEMFDVDALGGEEVFVAKQEVVSTAATTATITTKEITLAQALEAFKTSKSKEKEIVFQEPQPVKPRKKDQIRLDEEAALKLQAKFDEGERIARERAEKEQEANINKPPIQAQKRKIMCTYLKNMKGYKLKDLKLKEFDNIQEIFDRAFRRVNTIEEFIPEFVERKDKKAREELEQEITMKQKVEDDKEKAELKQLMETIPDKEEVAIDAIPLVVKSPRIVDSKIHKEGKKSYYQIVRANGKSQMYMFFSQMLKSFDSKDLEDLYKLVKARNGSTRPVKNMDYLLWSDMKLMFKPHVEDEVWKRQQGYKVLELKLYDSYRVHSLMM